MSKGTKANLSDAEPGNHAKISAGLGFLGMISCFGYESLLSWVTVSAFVAGSWLSISHLRKYKKQRGWGWTGLWLCVFFLSMTKNIVLLAWYLTLPTAYIIHENQTRHLPS